MESEIEAWPAELRARLARILKRIEAVGLPNVGSPHVEHLEGELWEMRPSGDKVEGRAIYVAVRSRRVVILVAFIKKQQRTPRRYIDLARQRIKEVQE